MLTVSFQQDVHKGEDVIAKYLSCLNNRVVINIIRIILEVLCVQVLGKK